MRGVLHAVAPGAGLYAWPGAPEALDTRGVRRRALIRAGGAQGAGGLAGQVVQATEARQELPALALWYAPAGQATHEQPPGPSLIRARRDGYITTGLGMPLTSVTCARHASCTHCTCL